MAVAAATAGPKDDVAKALAVAMVKQHPNLTEIEKHSMLWLMQQSPAFEGVITNEEVGLHNPPEWKTFSHIMHIKACRQDPTPPERTYKLRGTGEVQAPADVVYEMIIEYEYMKKWDPLLASHQKIEKVTCAYPLVAKGLAINTYGFPALSLLFSCRQLLYNVSSLHFPCGTRALLAYSPPEDVAQPGDPGTPARQVRAHMGVSGYVISPLGPNNTQVTAIIQVDPRGSVPLPVYNAVSMAMPMGIQSMRPVAAAVLKKPGVLEDIVKKHQDNIAEAHQIREAAEGQGGKVGADAAVAV